MRWYNFLECTPCIPHEIIVINFYVSEKGEEQMRVFNCRAQDYKRILGEHSLNERRTFWGIVPKNDLQNYEHEYNKAFF